MRTLSSYRLPIVLTASALLVAIAAPVAFAVQFPPNPVGPPALTRDTIPWIGGIEYPNPGPPNTERIPWLGDTELPLFGPPLSVVGTIPWIGGIELPSPGPPDIELIPWM